MIKQENVAKILKRGIPYLENNYEVKKIDIVGSFAKGVEKLEKLVLSISLIYFINICYASISFSEEFSKIAVIDLESQNISGGEAIIVTDFLRQDLVDTQKFILVERKKIEEILKEQKFQLSGCTTAECAVEVGKLLNVEKIVIGSINYLGQKYFINVRLVDVKSGEIIRAVESSCDTIEKLREITKIIASNLVDGKVNSSEEIYKSDKELKKELKEVLISQLGTLEIAKERINSDITFDLILGPVSLVIGGTFLVYKSYILATLFGGLGIYMVSSGGSDIIKRNKIEKQIEDVKEKLKSVFLDYRSDSNIFCFTIQF